MAEINIYGNKPSQGGAGNRTSSELRQSPVVVRQGDKERQVVVRKEQSFVKDYPTIRTFFENTSFEEICEANRTLIKKG
jgi:hypothetical protein